MGAASTCIPDLAWPVNHQPDTGMRLRPLLRIVALRYRLLWARVRSKQGKAILLLCGYFLIFPIVIALLAGGIGSGLAAIRTGRAELVAEIVLGSVYLDAILIAAILGIGSTPAFSDVSLRRYPLSPLERLGVRQVTAFLEPVWLFVLALDVGVAVGFHVFVGASSLWLAIPAAILLVMTNFLLARTLSVLVEWIVTRRGGALALMIAFVLLVSLVPFAPDLFGSAAWWQHGTVPALLFILQLTPPFAAAGVMVGSSVLASLYGLLLLLVWFFLFTTLLVLLECLPPAARAVAGAEAVWKGSYDRLAKAFGPSLSPLVGKILRYYVRSPQLWLSYPGAPIFSVFWALFLARREHDPLAGFLTMLAIISIVGYMSMGVMTMNAFGFDGSGFRRYFLFPVSPSVVFRAAALVPLLLGTVLIPITMGLWSAVWRGHVDALMVVMLLSSGFAGMFLFQALGLWTSLLTPRAMDFKIKLGNKLSLAQNALMLAEILVFIWLPTGLLILGSNIVLLYWWVLPLMMVAAACFYFGTLLAGARAFRARHERILSIIERGY
jgi:hypothetical protein